MASLNSSHTQVFPSATAQPTHCLACRWLSFPLKSQKPVEPCKTPSSSLCPPFTSWVTATNSTCILANSTVATRPGIHSTGQRPPGLHIPHHLWDVVEALPVGGVEDHSGRVLSLLFSGKHHHHTVRPAESIQHPSPPPDPTSVGGDPMTAFLNSPPDCPAHSARDQMTR